jgi:putative transcriptional regulator
MSLTGSFLVARQVLRDPNFERAVVLLLAHSDDGAFGLVVNRKATAKGLPWPLFVGGPCPSPGLMMLHGQAAWAERDGGEDEDEDEDEANDGKGVAPGIFVGDATALERAGNAEADEGVRFRVFTGYSGWGGGQLENELAAGAWVVVPAEADLLFDTPADELWDRLAPPALPQPSLN